MLLFLFYLESNSFICTSTTDCSHLLQLLDHITALLVNQNSLGEVLNRVGLARVRCASLDGGEPAAWVQDKRAVVRVEQSVDDLIDDFVSLGDGKLDSGGSSVLLDGTRRPSHAQELIISVAHLHKDGRFRISLLSLAVVVGTQEQSVTPLEFAHWVTSSEDLNGALSLHHLFGSFFIITYA